MPKMKAQLKIQQMAFMIVAVFFFFILVGLFFISWQSKSLTDSYEDLQKRQALSSLEVISNMPELNCDSQENLCLDGDKLDVLAGGRGAGYGDFWPVASVKVYKIYPSFAESGKVQCPALGCNYWEIYNSGQASSEEFSSYVNICRKMKEGGYVYNKCEIGKLVLGVILKDE
ncbi:hypothetical protein CMI37_19315 [Candidatus Pacearchaeota archaeon]|nr:hypothetical protein [Candidatus Pacearchaeota archaeon]